VNNKEKLHHISKFYLSCIQDHSLSL